MRIISASRAHLIAAAIGKLDFDLVILAVGHEVRRIVGNGVLISEFVADILKRLVQIVYVVRKKRASASMFG